jgi:hypothetical protein
MPWSWLESSEIGGSVSGAASTSIILLISGGGNIGVGAVLIYRDGTGVQWPWRGAGPGFDDDGSAEWGVGVDF